jgi:hypothetical protein
MTLPAHLLIRRLNFVEVYLDDSLVRSRKGFPYAAGINQPPSLAQVPRDCLVLSPLDSANRHHHFTTYAKSHSLFLIRLDPPAHWRRHVALGDWMHHRSALRSRETCPAISKPFLKSDHHRRHH